MPSNVPEGHNVGRKRNMRPLSPSRQGRNVKRKFDAVKGNDTFIFRQRLNEII
jgi:hypothetical protein